MSLSEVVAPLIAGGIGTVIASLVAAYVVRAKTGAEVDHLRAASAVAVSTDNREWAELFVQRADAAEKRAEIAEHRADEAELRVDELEARVIKTWTYVRSLRELMRAGGVNPPPLPKELEHLWNNGDNGR